MEQVCEAPVRHGVMSRSEAQAAAIALFKELDLPTPRRSAAAIRTRSPAASCSG